MQPCVVVLEDEPTVLQMLDDLFSFLGYRVVEVAHPDDLERVLKTVHPDLFLIDVMLPGGTGIEVAERLRSRGFEGTPMIGVSASRIMTDLASHSGVFDTVMCKPFDLDRLWSTVEGLLRRPARKVPSIRLQF